MLSSAQARWVKASLACTSEHVMDFANVNKAVEDFERYVVCDDIKRED